MKRNKQNKKTGLFVPIAAVAAAAAAAAVMTVNGEKAPVETAEPVKFRPYYDCGQCVHDESTYREPTAKEGRYYLDGDTDQCYFELKDGCIALVGTDEQIQKLADKTADAQYPATIEKIRDDWGTEPCEYYIYTMHPYGDAVMLSWEGNVIFDETGKIERGSGVSFNDTTSTISGYWLGDFTLVE